MLQLYISYAIGKARLTNGIKSFLSDQSGVTAIEYGLIASLVGLAIITGATLLGNQLNLTFKNIANTLANP